MISSPPPPRPHLETRSTSLLTLPTRTTKLSEEAVEEEISDNMNTAQKVTRRTNADQMHKGQEEDMTKGKMSDKVLRSTKRGLWMTSNSK